VTDEAAFKARVENLKTRTVNLPEHDAPPFPLIVIDIILSRFEGFV
jgi:hypothetical protein